MFTIHFGSRLRFFAEGKTGVFKDKAGRRYRLDKGKRVPLNDSQGAKPATPKVKAEPAPAAKTKTSAAKPKAAPKAPAAAKPKAASWKNIQAIAADPKLSLKEKREAVLGALGLGKKAPSAKPKAPAKPVALSPAVSAIASRVVDLYQSAGERMETEGKGMYKRATQKSMDSAKAKIAQAESLTPELVKLKMPELVEVAKQVGVVYNPGSKPKLAQAVVKAIKDRAGAAMRVEG